jgi:hypothetical protein
VATLIHLRYNLPHSVLELLFGVDRCTVTRAIGEIRALLAERGCAVPDQPGLRLRTLADVFVHAQAEGVELRLDATEIQVPLTPSPVRTGQRPAVRSLRLLLIDNPDGGVLEDVAAIEWCAGQQYANAVFQPDGSRAEVDQASQPVRSVEGEPLAARGAFHT